MVSTKMAKTIVVEVTRRVPHPIYKRIVTKQQEVLRARRTEHGARWAMWCGSSSAAR